MSVKVICSGTLLKQTPKEQGECPYYGGVSLQTVDFTVEALISRHPWDAKKVSVTGAGPLREWFL